MFLILKKREIYEITAVTNTHERAVTLKTIAVVK